MFGLYIPIRHRSVDIAGSAMPMQKIENIDPPFDVGADFTMHLLNPENDTSVNLIKSDIILQ